MGGMMMSSGKGQISHTQHALLVAWGCFAEEIGLSQKIEAVKLKQKTHTHTPQSKTLEFLVAHLGGLEHLQDISLSAHPLDKDQAVAEAWGQSGWADYTGVSRTLSGLRWDEADQIVEVLQDVSQPFLEREIRQMLEQKQRLWFDGDLTGIPVSDTSQSYPHTAFGHMADDIRLGYQAAVVSMESPTYRRLWLSIAHHPGDTVSCTQAEALARTAEARIGLRPWRRTDLLRQRVETFQAQMKPTQERLEKQRLAVVEAEARLTVAGALMSCRQEELHSLEQVYQARQRQERPTSYLAKARQRFQAAQRKCARGEKSLGQAQQRLAKTQALWDQRQVELTRLQERLEQFERDNATNSQPVDAVFRLDAGFGTYENVALLIEMGYEVYTKPYSHQVVAHLKRQVTEQAQWTRVGANAEMVAWPDHQLKGCPYPLDIALERFYTGKTIKYSALLHFGTDPVTEDLTAWFHDYNGRQIVEAGIKEGKLVFHLHRIKVRSEPAIYLQEQFVIFAANFIRWATHWLAGRQDCTENALDISTMGVKKQVQVAAHTSAEVIWHSDGRLLRFSEHSAFAGKVLNLSSSGQCRCQEQRNLHFLGRFRWNRIWLHNR
jgi:hypothetical protein